MSRILIGRYSDHQVIAVAPIDISSDPNVVLDDDAGVVSSAYKVYDPNRDEVLSADEASSQTELSVTNAGIFVESDTIEVTLDSGALHTSTISSIDTSAGTITLAAGLASGASAGNRVRKIFGSSISMTEYGTADLNTRDWGYSALLPDDHVVHDDIRAKAGLDVDFEISFNGGAGLAAFGVICATIQEDDCV